METIILFVVAFLFAFIGRFLIFLFYSSKKRKNKRKKNVDGVSIEMLYLLRKFKVQQKKINKKSFALLLSFLDALIISTTVLLVVMLTDNLILQLIIGFLVMMAMIFLVYELLGRILIWKGYDKE